MKRTIKISLGSFAAAAFAMIAAAACSMGDMASSPSGSESSRGGSMARFAISGDHLYTVAHSGSNWNNDKLTVFSLENPAKPLFADEVAIGTGIETLFVMGDKMFIGSTTAMYIYDISDPENPQKLSQSTHFRSCDPVVAYGDWAYVTLNSSLGRFCGSSGDELKVYDITDLEEPVLAKTVQMTSPRGLAVDGAESLLFVCDSNVGVRAYDITDPTDPQRLYTLSTVAEASRIDAYDCIAMNGVLMVIGADGLYQVSYTRDGFEFLSKIDLR